MKNESQNLTSEIDNLISELLGKPVSLPSQPTSSESAEIKNTGTYQLPVKHTRGGKLIDEKNKPWVIGTFIPDQYLNVKHPHGHNGVDLAAPRGAPVYPIGPGKVIEAKEYPKGGKTVKIQHEDGNVVSYYAHLDSVRVSVGNQVDFNTVIGTVGDTGNAKGTHPHLHYEVRVDGKRVNPRSIEGKTVGILSKKAQIIKSTFHDLEKFSKQLSIKYIYNKNFIVKYANRLDDAKERFPNLPLAIEDLAKNDPSGNYAYLLWMAGQIDKGHSTNDLYPTIRSFHNNKKRLEIKDLYQYQDLKDLENAIKDLPPSKRQQKKKLKQDIKSGGNSALIYQNENIAVVRPDDKASCISLGGNTRWCITMENESYYEEYAFNNVVFYFILRKDPQGDDFDKVALAYQRDLDNNLIKLDIFNANDQKINDLSYLGNLGSYILEITQKDAENYSEGLIVRILRGEVFNQEFLQYFNTLSDENIKRGILRKIPLKYVKLIDLSKFDLDEQEKIEILKKTTVYTNRGDKFWYLNGQLHREGGPAVEYTNGYKAWYLNGQRHREDGPAVEYTNGYEEWYLNGQRHREDGPAVEYASGYKEWYLNGQRHREDGPAVEYPSGTKRWYLNGQLHREDGPAIEYSSGSKFWCLNGQRYRESSFA